MQVQEKTRHINVSIQGLGLEVIRAALTQAMPEAVITDDDDELFEWEQTDIAKRIQINKTPGKILQAYRERAGLSIIQLAEKTGFKYTNISAMEHDNRAIGFSSAKKLALALGCDYTKFLSDKSKKAVDS